MSVSPWTPDALDSLPSLLAYANENELRQMERDLPLLSPATFALTTSQGKWRRAKHLDYLDRAITRAIDDAAAGLIDGLIVTMPPQHGKSALCSCYLPAWYLGTYPDRRVILAGYEADFAAGWGRKARNLLEEHGRVFGVAVSKRSSATHRWDIEGHDGGMTTSGVGGPITGRGAHLLVIDDPIKNDEEARSSTQRQKQWDWWQSTASTRLRPGGLTVLIQTRWHRDDLAGRILREGNPNRWRLVKLPALAEADDPLGRAPGEALWPEVYSVEHLERVRDSHTAYYWNAMYQQSPIAEGSTEWPDSWFGPDIWFDRWPDYWQIKTVALDPSKGTDAKHGDYSAFVMLLVAENGTLYVDANLEVRNCELIVDTAIEIQRQFNPDAFAIEENQFQHLLATIINERSRRAGIVLPLYTVNNSVNKQVRIRRLTPYLGQKQIRFKAGSPGAKLLVNQLREFPLGDHDDGPDAAEMAIRLAAEQLSLPEPEPILTVPFLAPEYWKW